MYVIRGPCLAGVDLCLGGWAIGGSASVPGNSSCFLATCFPYLEWHKRRGQLSRQPEGLVGLDWDSAECSSCHVQRLSIYLGRV